ncbi:MAG: DUF6340 family protein [Bacteroidota bacterium]|nr:DUF6340 family protein [Bacteroidota bacterium]
MMIRTVFHYGVILPGLAMILSSCILAYNYQAEILFPAQIDVSPDVENVGVFCRMDLGPNPSGYFSGNEWEKSFKSDSALLKQAILGLEDGLIESPRYSVIETITKRNLPGFLPQPSKNLNWKFLRNIYPDSTGLLIELATASFSDTVIDLNTNDNIVENYYCILSTFFWRLYNFNAKEISLYRIQDTTIIEFRNRGNNFRLQDTRHLLRLMNSASYNAGISFASGIAPTWKEINRIYYKSSIPIFHPAEKLVVEGDWKGAAEEWLPFTKSNNKIIASRASFNMAVAAEMTDHFALAIEWLEKSKELGQKRYVDEYTADLLDRISQKAKLDLQFGELEQ